MLRRSGNWLVSVSVKASVLSVVVAVVVVVVDICALAGTPVGIIIGNVGGVAVATDAMAV